MNALRQQRSKFRALFFALAGVAAAAAPSARADVYYSTCNESSRLCSFDTVSGLETSGPLFSGGSTYGIAIASDGVSAYSLLNSSKTLAKLNLSTGSLTKIGVGNSSFMGYALDFDNSGVLWAADTFTNQLFTVNTATGLFNFVSSVSGGLSNIMDFTFDVAGNMFAIGDCGNPIFKVNPLTGVSSVAYSNPLSCSMGIAADTTGDLIVTGYGDNRFAKIRESDGAVLGVFALPESNASYHGGDIVLGHAIPEPTSMSLFGLSLIGLGFSRRKIA